jgi:UrcA family protein
MKTLKLFAVSTALVAGSLACAVPAAAADTSQTVKYSAVELNTTAGTAALYRRLKNAAWRVCRDTDYRIAPNQFVACMQQAVDGAVRDIDRPNLNALHEGRAGTGLTAQR